jgi:hypothetical protein
MAKLNQQYGTDAMGFCLASKLVPAVRWGYLVCVCVCCTREIIGWNFSQHCRPRKANKPYLENARRENEQTFRREYLAEFTDNVFGWITPEILEPCIMRGQRELPPVANGTYVAAIDPAFRSSEFAFSVLHRSDNGQITVVYATRWIGTKTKPLNFQPVCEQIAKTVMRYGINALYGDQYCFQILRQHFVSLGIHYEEFPFGARTER